MAVHCASDLRDVRLTLLKLTINRFNRGLDFTPSPTEPHLREDTPVIVVLHGLTGGESCLCRLDLRLADAVLLCGRFS